MKPKTVLIADDDQTFVRVMTMRCRFLGLDVRTCSDAMFALTLIHKDPPDLVLLDINMPAGNGLAVCEMLSTDRRLSSVPVIILTGSLDDETKERCRALNTRYFLKSPNLWDRLKPVVCDMLDIQPDDTE